MTTFNQIAIVGLGLIGIRHLQAIQAAKNASLHAIVDVTEESKKVANKYGVPHFNSIETLLNHSSKPDGVIVATPNEIHISIAKQCIEENIPVLVEKPLATDIESAKELLFLSDKKNTPVLTGYFRRYNPLVSAAKQEIEQGNLGDIVAVHTHFWLHKHKQYFNTSWRTEESGGPIHINLAHDIDILLYLIGNINKVTTYLSNQTRGLKVEDTAVIICQFKNGTLGTINMSDTIPAPWSWELTAGDNPTYPKTDQAYCFIGGTKGSIEFPKNKLWYYEQEKSWYTPINTKTFMKAVRDPLIAQIEHFSRVISEQEAPIVTGYDGLNVMKVINTIKQSAKTDQSVYL